MVELPVQRGLEKKIQQSCSQDECVTSDLCLIKVLLSYNLMKPPAAGTLKDKWNQVALIA